MSLYAQIDENNQVTQVIVADQDFINSAAGTWIESCALIYNNGSVDLGPPLHKKHASIGDTYNESLDAFISPKPFNSWTLNETTYTWEAPIPMPNDSNEHVWDEAAQQWQ